MMDGRSAASILEENKNLGGEQKSTSQTPKKTLFYSSFFSFKIVSFQKCKKYKDRWAKPLSSVHICGTWKIILVQISTMMLLPL